MAALVRQKDKETDTEKARAKTPGRSKSRAASRRQERAEKAEDLVELNIRWVRLVMPPGWRCRCRESVG
jgi:hypothetical protein